MLVVLSVFGTIFDFQISNHQSSVSAEKLPSFSTEELKTYDGSDPSKPIYLALDGFVYDVTPGKEFYQKQH